MTDDDPDEEYVEMTPEELAAERKRHAAMAPVIRPLFAAPVVGDGVLADTLIERPPAAR